ncbi:hypothetical protein N7501_006290 [Penicillium viridicatum]|nr:hypothetical protein N7501_006290 [Penicillium viridicatum]
MGFMSFRVRDPIMPGFWDGLCRGKREKTHSAGNHSKTDHQIQIPRIGGVIAVQQREERHPCPVLDALVHKTLQSTIIKE